MLAGGIFSNGSRASRKHAWPWEDMRDSSCSLNLIWNRILWNHFKIQYLVVFVGRFRIIWHYFRIIGKIINNLYYHYLSLLSILISLQAGAVVFENATYEDYPTEGIYEDVVGNPVTQTQEKVRKETSKLLCHIQISRLILALHLSMGSLCILQDIILFPVRAILDIFSFEVILLHQSKGNKLMSSCWASVCKLCWPQPRPICPR